MHPIILSSNLIQQVNLYRSFCHSHYPTLLHHSPVLNSVHYLSRIHNHHLVSRHFKKMYSVVSL